MMKHNLSRRAQDDIIKLMHAIVADPSLQDQLRAKELKSQFTLQNHVSRTNNYLRGGGMIEEEFTIGNIPFKYVMS